MCEVSIYVVGKWCSNIAEWCCNTYKTINDNYLQRVQLKTEISMQQNKKVANTAKTWWNAYETRLELERESTMLQGAKTVDMLDSWEDIERSIDVVEATVGAAVATNTLVEIIMCPAPISLKTAGIVAVGVIWAIRGVIRSVQ